MQQLGEMLQVSTTKRFAEGVSPDGVRWAPKSQTTLERYGIRRSNRIDIRPLFGPSGALNSTISAEPAGRGAGRVGLVYAAVQHFGAAKGAFGTMSNGSPIPWATSGAALPGCLGRGQVGIAATVEDYLTAPCVRKAPASPLTVPLRGGRLAPSRFAPRAHSHPHTLGG